MTAVMACVFVMGLMSEAGAQTLHSTTGEWILNANGNWSTTSAWANLDPTTDYPSGQDAIANLGTLNITATRIITLNVPVTLGTLIIGDTTGNNSYTIQSGTLTFDSSTGFALLEKVDGGANDTISSAIAIASGTQLDVTVKDTSNSQGIVLSGVISGGTNGSVTMTFEDLSAETPTNGSLNYLYLSGANTFEGRLEIKSGLLRLEGNNAAAGAVGVGNETIVLSGGGVDLRGRALNLKSEDTEIFKIAGIGPNGLGALRNTTGTAYLSHLALTSSALMYFQSTTVLERHQDAAGTAGVASILDFGGPGNNLTKIGPSDFIVRGADVLNANGASLTINEGEVRFESRGLLSGSGASTGINLDGLTVNIAYNRNPYDNVDPANGSRTTTDAFSVNINQSATQGNTVNDARFSMASYWGASVANTGTLAEQAKETLTFDGMTFNFNNGVFQREGNSDTGRTFDHIFTNVTVNIVGAGIGRNATGNGNLFDIQSGSANYNSTTGAYDHPGSTIFQGSFVGAADTGFTVRGSRELRVEGASTGFLGDILIKQATGRNLPAGFNTTNGAIEAQYASFVLSGANGSFTSANSITLERYGNIWLDNQAANNNDRLKDTGMLNFRDGHVILTTNAAVENTENLGNLNSQVGTNKIFIDSRPGGRADITINSLNISAGSVLNFENVNSGSDWGIGLTDDRIALTNTASVTTSGNLAPTATTDRAVILGAFGGDVPTPGAYTVAQRPAFAVENGYARSGAADRFLTLDGGFIRPLLDSEYDTSAADPGTGTNWKVITEIGNTGLRTNLPNVTSNLTINSLVISNASVPTAAKEYVIIDNLATLTINSGMINFSNFAQTTSANMESVISGGRIDMNGQQAIVNSSSFFEDLDRNDANYYSYITGYNSFMRSSITNANGLVKTGRNNLYLDTFNEFIPGSTLYVTDEASVIVRHSLALQGIDEVYVTGAGNFLLQTGVNIVGTNLRVGSQDTSRVVLRSETNGHNTWAGNVILDNIDTAGSKEFTQPVIGALNDATLTVYGNISTSVAANAAAIDSDSFDDPFILSTSTGQSGTLNLRGQVRDLPTGTFANPVYRYGDSATNTDTNHSLSFNMTGHDENNVNVFQQWNATGRLNLARGFFRVMYDPNAPGNDGIGFLTDTANALILRNDYWTRTALGVDGASTGTYDSHLMLTKAGQVYNWANQISIYNNNRDGTINIGGENESGSVYIGSDDGVNYSIVFENQGGDRDVRFLQTRGGTLVINARLVDNGTSVNSIANVTGPGTIIFNANGAGASTVERWNFMGGDVFWQANPANDSLLGNDRFGIAAAQAMFGGGSLTYNAGSAASRTENLTGNFRLLSGESEINVISYTGLTDTLNFGAAAATFAKNQGGTMRFIEAGDGTAVITLQATGLTGTGLMSYATYGTAVGVVTDFASNDAGGQISAFSGYVAGSAEADFTGGNTVDVTVDVAFTGAATPDNLRFDAPVALTLDTQAMTLGGGAILITSANSGVNSISGGTLTSSFDADLGGAGTRTDLMIQNYGSGTLTLGATLTDNGGDKMNLVLGGQGTTVLTGTNTMTGEIYLNNGVLSISSESNLGVIDGSIATLARVNIGGSNGASLTGAPLIFSTGGVDGGAAGTFNTNSSQQVTATTLTSGGSGYTSGVYVTNAAAGSAGIWAVLDSGNLHFDGGTLAVTQDVTLDGARTLFLGSNGGFLDVTSGKTLTINGYLTSEFSHINAANGFTANHTGGTDAPAMDGNPDIGDLIIQGGGTVVLTGAPNNSLQSNMFNSYGGITWINEGSLKLASYGSTATGILGSNRSWIDGTIIGANGTLELSMTSDNTMYEWITFRGRGYEGRGTILTTGNTSTRYHRLSGQMFIESDILINITDTSTVRFNENGGTFYGTGDIYRKGVGEFQFYGNAPEWEGAYIAGSGNTRLYGDANFTGLTGITLDRNTYFGFNASSNDRNMFDDRMPDTTPIYGYSYAKLRMEGTSAVHSGRARVGIATAATGVFGIEYDLASIVTGGAVEQGLTSAGWRFAELVRNEGAVFQFRNLDPGTDFARGATFGITDFDNRAILTVDTAPAVVGIGNGLDGNTPIIPGFFGGTRPEFLGYTTGIYLDEDRTSRFLMTVEAGTDAIYGGAVNYLRPLSDAPGSTDYKIIADPGNNTASVTVDLALAGTTADQNLRFVGLTTDAIGSGNGLTSLVNSSLTLDTTLIANSVSFGADVVGENTNGSGNRVNLDMGQNGTLQINSGVLMFANIGTMDRLGSSYNTGVNLDMTNFITGGRMDFNGKEAIIYAGSQWAQYNISGSNLNHYNNTDADGTAAYLRTNIVNTGGHGLTKTGASSVLLERANNYTGNTNITMGYLYARHDLAFGQSTRVNLTGTGGLILGNSSQIMGVDLYIGAISGNNLTLYTEGEGNEWGGNVIIDNVDATGTAGGSQRNFVPRIQVASSNTVFHIDGNIYGGDTPVALGAQGTAARIFTTYTAATSSVLDILGQVKDKSSGAIAAGSNMNEALRMEVVGTNDLATVHLYSQYDAAGRINLVRGVLRYMGDGNFYTDAAALALDPNNEMSGLQMGGRSLLTGDGVDTADVSLFLNKAGTAFNLSSWKVGVDIADPANFFASGNYGLGNTTGNSTIGGENNSGTITFGTGTGSILFTQADAAYDRNLNLYSTRGGEVDMKVNFVDGGNLVKTSITKVGAGTVNLLGSSAGDSTVEALKMLGGTLVMQGYDVNANRRIGNGAALTLSGGYLIVDANSATGPVVEDFSDLTLNSGGSRLAVRGNATVSIISTASLVPASGVTMAFVENNGGVINLSAPGMTTTDGERFGWWAVYGNVLGQVTDWAAREGTTGVKAFTNYDVNTFGSGNNTSVTTGTTLGGNTATGSLQVAAASALDLGGNTLTVENGGILISAAVGGPVSITNGTLTRSGAGDILLHNYGVTTIAAAITNDGANAVNLVTGGVGTLTLTGANTYTGDTFVNGGTLEISSESALGQINGSIVRLVREYNGTNGSGSNLTFSTTVAPTTAATGTFAGGSAATSTNLTGGGSGYSTGIHVNARPDNTSNAGIWAILDSGNLHLDGGTLGVKDDITLDGARTIFLGASGGTLTVDAGKTLTINGYITSDVTDVPPPPFDSPIELTRPFIGGLAVEGGGTVVLTGAPDNTSREYMFNGYNALTSINEGAIKIAGLASSATNALGTYSGWNDSTYIGPNGSLLLNVTNADIGLYEWLTLDGQGYQGGGTIQAFNGTSSVRSHYLRGQINVLQDAVFNLRNGSNIYLQNGGGEVIGSGDIIKIGNGDFRFYGNSPYWTGGFVLASGSSRMYDGSAMQGMASMTLQRNGYFAINADSTTSDELRNRLDDDLLVFTDGYIRMRIEAYSSVFSGIEKVGTATVLGGQLGLEFDLGSTIAGGTPVLGGDYAGWHFTEIVRSPGTTVQLRSLDVGTSFADSTFATDAATGADRAVVMVDVLPTLIGTGDGTNGNAKIAPGFFGGVRPDWINSAGTGTVFNEDYIANRLVTVDTNLAGDNFLRPLLDSEYKVVSNPDTAQTTTIALEQQGITADQNVKIVGVITDTGIGAGEFTDRRNSILTLGTGNGVCAPATGNDLTINSLTFESTSYVSGAGSGRGNYTALMLGDGAVLTINSGVIQLYNTGIQNRNGAAYDANTNMDIRSAILGGSVNFAGQEAIFNIGGIWAHYNTSDAASAYRATDFDSNYLFMNSSIVNGTGLTKTGGASLFLNAPNYYSGPTSVNQGYLYARHDNALGTSTQVNVTGAGSFAVGLGARITDVDLYVGKLNGINLALQIENNSVWAGNVIIDNVDSGGATAYVRSFVPRIFNNQTGVGTIEGNIYGGSTTIGSGALTESRMFSTYTGAFGLLDIRGQVRDTATGAITGPVDIFNQSQVLRMEVTATNNESAVQLGQQYDAAGRINLIRGALYYAGSGDFYTTAAAATANSAPLNPMIGLQMGGRSVTSDNGRGAANLAFFLLNGGQNFNLKSWQVGVDINDPDNTAANYTYGEGNTTGNSTLGGVNTSGTVTFGTGAGSIIFTQATTSYSRDLGLFAARGGEVDFKVNFVDGGNLVTSSVTKLGAGQVNLLGSTAGDSTVEGVNVMGGILAMGGYNTNLNRRVGNGAGLTLAGGTLVMDGSGASFTENFGTLKVNQGGNAIAAAGNGTTNFGTVSILAASITRAAGGTLHFQSIAGGTIHFSNAAMQNVARIGSYATFGANFAFTPAATDWAATDAAGNVMAYTGYGVDAFGAATQTDVQGAGLTAATTNSVRFNDAAGTITGGTLTLNDGGILITSNYTTGTPVGAGVGVTTSATGTDLLIHNFATGVVSFDGDISGAQNVVFGGAGTLSLGGTNIYTGATHVTGSATVAFDDVTRFGSTSGIFLNGGTLQYSAVASTSAALTQNITLGGGNGTLSVADADSRLVIRGLATNQISSEANNIISAYGTNNPNAGGLQILGPGTVQFGDRSATTQDLLGVVNNYTGLTVLGDGVAALRVDIQGMGNNNDQYAPFGTTESWADATIVRNNVTIEFSHKRTAQTAQIRFREWFQIGEQAGDQILFDGSTQRQPTLDGILNIIGDLTFETQGNRYADAGSTGNSEFLINPNEGGVMGGGDIIKKGDGNLRFYKPLHEWTGDLRIEDGFLGMQMNSGNMFNATGKIYFGDPTGTQTSLVRLRIENLYYSNNTIGLDSPKIDLTVNRDIIVNDDIKQQVQISAGYQPASATIHFTGNINVGNGSNNSVDFYYEDNNNLDPAIVGHVQQTVFDISGNLSGSNPIYLDSNNNGGNAKDATFAVVFSGDNSGYSGLLTIGKDTGATDNPLRGVTLRIGDVTDLGTNSTLRFRNYGILQLAGNSMTLSQDLVFTGNASRAVSAGIENGSSAAATVTFDSGTQTGSNYQDVSVGLRDGVAASVFGGGNAALSVIKVGSGDTVLGRNTGGTTPDEFSRYTGTTSVQEGILYAGSNNVFSPYSRFILADGATLSPYWDNVSTGYTVSIGSLSGTAGAAVNITKSTLNVGGDDTSGANFAGVISGSGAGTNLNKVGAGSQELSGANTFTGGVAVNQGTLIGSSDSAFGDAANAINLGGVVDARVELLLGGTAAVLANPVLMNSSGGNDQGITLIGTRETSGTYGFSSTVGLYQNVATNVFVEAQGTSVFQFGAAVQDAGAGVMPLIKIGSGTVELQAANTYGSGGTWSAGTAIDGGTLIRNGTLSVFDSAALSTTVVELGDTRVTLALSADLATNRSLITPDGGGTFDAASDGAGGAGNGAFLNVKAEVDGVLLTVADIGKRILVKDEGNDPERNGVFVVVSFDDTCGQMNLVRATDFDEASEMRYGTGIAVSGGTQAGNQFFMAAADVAAVNGDGTDPVYWLADVENPHVGLLAGAAGLTVMNDIDINDTNGTGSTILGGTFTTGTTEFQGAVTLQNNATPGVDNQRELIFTSASNDAGGGVLITGAVTQDNETILSVTKQGAGTVTLANGLTNYTGKTTISEGTLALTGAGTIATSSWIDIASGATFESSTGAGDFTFDGPISGAGTVKTGTGSLIVGTTSGAGVLKPGVTSDPSAIGTAGDQVGTLTVTGNVVLTGSTGGADRLTLQMGSTSGADYNDETNIYNHLGAGDYATWVQTQEGLYNSQTMGNHDRLNVSGSVTLNAGGTIRFTRGGLDYQPVLGDVFNLIDWATINPNGFDVGNGGAFRSGGLLGDLELPDLGLSGLQYDTSLFTSSGIVVVVPEPGRIVLLMAGLLGLFLRRRRPDIC